MAELKPGWQRVRFGDVVRLARETCHDPIAAGIERVIGLEHLEPGDLRVRSWAAIADGTTFTSRVRPGQVLFGKRRAYQRKLAVAEFDAVCSGDIYLFESADSERLLPALLPFICQTDAFWDHAVGTSAGSLSPRTTWTSLATYEFALPPLEQQSRHVSALQALEQSLEAMRLAASSLTTLRQSLTETRMSEFPRGMYAPLSAIVRSQAPLCYGIVQPGAAVSQGTRMVRVCDITDDGAILNPSSIAFVSAAVDQQYRRSRVEAGDLLISVVGTIGRVAVVPAHLSGYNIARALARVRLRAEVIPEFIALVLQSPSFSRRLNAESFETARKTLNLSTLAAILIPVPPLEVQLQHLSEITSLTAAGSQLSGRAKAVGGMRKAMIRSFGLV